MRNPKKRRVVKVKVVKAKSGKRLTGDQIEEMFLAYAGDPNVGRVAKSAGVSRTTVQKYRDRDNWDRRREQILQDVRKKSDNETAKALSANLKVVRFAKAKIVKQIQAGKDKSTSTYADLDRLIRLEGFLLGQPDSRSTVGRFEHLTDAQLDEKLKQIESFHE